MHKVGVLEVLLGYQEDGGCDRVHPAHRHRAQPDSQGREPEDHETRAAQNGCVHGCYCTTSRVLCHPACMGALTVGCRGMETAIGVRARAFIVSSSRVHTGVTPCSSRRMCLCRYT